jgi:hypothetical protein
MEFHYGYHRNVRTHEKFDGVHAHKRRLAAIKLTHTQSLKSRLKNIVVHGWTYKNHNSRLGTSQTIKSNRLVAIARVTDLAISKVCEHWRDYLIVHGILNMFE